jgi:hypothetical protein
MTAVGLTAALAAASLAFASLGASDAQAAPSLESCQIAGAHTEAEWVTLNEQRRACENKIRAEERAEREAEEAHRKYEQEAPAREAAAAAAKAAVVKAAFNAEEARLQREYEAEKSRAHETPVRHLTVAVEPEIRNSSRNPGESRISVTSTSFAHVTIKLTRYGHRTYRFNNDPEIANARSMAPGEGACLEHEWTESCASTEPEPVWPITTSPGTVIPWTCGSPGGVYHYVITARSNVGRALTKRGTFRPVSAERCRTLKHREQEARERNARRYAEKIAQQNRAASEAIEHEEYNCRASNGTIKEFVTEEGRERRCVGPEISVPL